MPQPSWCRNLTKRATVSIDVLFINTISDAVHSCTCHDVPGRALNRLVINRTSASATDKMCGGRFIPFTGRIVHFIASKPQTGLARGQCQSGAWRAIGAPDGSYTNLGSHRGTFNGRNNGSGTLFVYASGGNGAGGGDCANTSNLQGYVNGAFIGMNASNNPSYGKTAFISFAVPVGASYQIISRPTQNYACGNGVFSVYVYQM